MQLKCGVEKSVWIIVTWTQCETNIRPAFLHHICRKLITFVVFLFWEIKNCKSVLSEKTVCLHAAIHFLSIKGCKKQTKAKSKARTSHLAGCEVDSTQHTWGQYEEKTKKTWLGMLVTIILFYQDIARLFELIQHLPYSPDFAPSDFSLPRWRRRSV